MRSSHETIRDLSRITIVTLWILIAAGCASGFDPKPVDSVPFRDRAETKIDRGVRVTTAVPSASETSELFGISLYRKRLQPVWLEIENNTDATVTFLPVGLDRDYHSPIEVASLNRKRKTREQAEQYFFNSGVDMQIEPGKTRSGFIFTNTPSPTSNRKARAQRAHLGVVSAVDPAGEPLQMLPTIVARERN